MDNESITVTELSKQWRCSKRTIYRLIDDRQLRAFRLGRDFRIELAEVNRFKAPPLTETA